MPTRFVTTTTLPLIVLAAATGLSGCRGPQACGQPHSTETYGGPYPQAACHCDASGYQSFHAVPPVTSDGWMRMEPAPAQGHAVPDNTPAPRIPEQLAPPPPPAPKQDADEPAEAEMTRIRPRHPFATTAQPPMQPVSRSHVRPGVLPHQNAMAPVPRQPLPQTAMIDRRAVALQMPDLPADRPSQADPFDDPFFGGGHSIPPAIASALPVQRHAAAPTLLPAPALQAAPDDETVPLTPVPEDARGPLLLTE